ncbi:hypothetical protein GCM10023208_25350 [Erythrobacter westpacificensis]|uniref:site-specific DNA-methyltransferase (adenine-specific) n=1 Tax=Erythrobacter westpacificensis TaxID=1055231 RepID=A0ABP9KJE9_9SPHN
MAIDKPRAAVHLKAFDFSTLFVEELGWDRPTSRQTETVEVGRQQFTLSPIADKRGVRIFQCPEIPDRATRQRIEREITKLVYEHLIIFTDSDETKQIWQWVAREKGKPAAFREHLWLASTAPDALLQKLDHISFTLSEEEGLIFEKYINQKQMGAYYTKEDITDYITKSTVVPWLFQNAIGHDKVAFEPGGFVWRLLSENPDNYIYPSVRHGMDSPLPEEIAAGIADVSQRGDWNKTAPREFGLPTEIWREVVARRQRYEATRSKAATGEITSIEDFITYNLDIRQFARDVIQYAESPDVVRAFWKGISSIKILDPACGSGAFLFAALNILYDLYDACLERMEQFVASAPPNSHGRGQHYSDFQSVLAQIAQHPNRDYFIYKSIIIANLFGVDIMDEAVEICKLRLFLKLAAQLEDPKKIEPLPDIDFNIRSGNSLVGFTSIEEMREAATANGFDFHDGAETIEATAQDLDQAFRLFREQQTTLNGSIEASHKADLRERLKVLGRQLNQFLARDHGLSGGDGTISEATLAAWAESHRPFHWLIEFYGTMKNGGFDIIVGNPPEQSLLALHSMYSRM